MDWLYVIEKNNYNKKDIVDQTREQKCKRKEGSMDMEKLGPRNWKR